MVSNVMAGSTPLLVMSAGALLMYGRYQFAGAQDPAKFELVNGILEAKEPVEEEEPAIIEYGAPEEGKRYNGAFASKDDGTFISKRLERHTTPFPEKVKQLLTGEGGGH